MGKRVYCLLSFIWPSENGLNLLNQMKKSHFCCVNFLPEAVQDGNRITFLWKQQVFLSSAQPTAFACGAVDACPGLIAAGLVKWLPLTATYTAYRSKGVNTPSAAAVKISHVSPNSLKSSSSIAPSEHRPENWKKTEKSHGSCTLVMPLSPLVSSPTTHLPQHTCERLCT